MGLRSILLLLLQECCKQVYRQRGGSSLSFSRPRAQRCPWGVLFHPFFKDEAWCSRILHGHFPSHIFDQSSASVKPPASAFPKSKSIFFPFRDLTRIIDLDHGPWILAVGPNRKLSSFFRNGIGGIVKKIIDHPFSMKGKASNL